MFDDAFTALVSAWYVTLTASLLLLVALAVAPYWDRAVYLKALHEALVTEPI